MFDHVVVAHGPDASAPDAGGPVDATRGVGKMVPRFVDGQLVDLESEDGAVRVIGAPIWSAGWDIKDPTTKKPLRMETPEALKDWNKARKQQAQDLPAYSRGVNDSIAMAVRTITSANQGGEEP